MSNVEALARQAAASVRTTVDSTIDTEAALAAVVRAGDAHGGRPSRRRPRWHGAVLVAALTAAAATVAVVAVTRSDGPGPLPPAASTTPPAPSTTASGSPVTISISAPITVDPEPWSPPSETVVVADNATSSWSIGTGPESRRLAYPDGYGVGAMVLGPAGVVYVAYDPTSVLSNLPLTLVAYRLADMAAGRLDPVMEKVLPLMDGPAPSATPTAPLNRTRAVLIRGEHVRWECPCGTSTEFRLVDLAKPGTRAVLSDTRPDLAPLAAAGPGITDPALVGTTRTHAVFVADIPAFAGRGLVVVDAQGVGRIVRLPAGARESSLSVDETGVVVAEVSGDQWRLIRLRLED